MASSRAAKRPPSEKESGVTLRTPIRSGRSPSRSTRPSGNGKCRRGAAAALRSVIFQIGETLIRLGRALERTFLLAGPPGHDLLDLAGEREILLGDAFRAMRLQAHLGAPVGGLDVWMVPCSLGEMPDRVHDHQGALPAMRLVDAHDEAAVEPPMRQLGLEALADLRFAESLVLRRCHF